MSLKAIDRLGMICLCLILTVFILSIPLRCMILALSVGSVSAAAGGLCGLALAGVTRTRNPTLIYTGLIIALACLCPLLRGWPPADSTDVFAWRGAPNIVYNYFDVARGCFYLFAFPYPFARFGHHAADTAPVTNTTELSASASDTTQDGQPDGNRHA